MKIEPEYRRGQIVGYLASYKKVSVFRENRVDAIIALFNLLNIIHA